MGGAAAKEPKDNQEEGRKKRQTPPAQDAFVAPSKELPACADGGQLARSIDWHGLERDPVAPLLLCNCQQPLPRARLLGSLADAASTPPCRLHHLLQPPSPSASL